MSTEFPLLDLPSNVHEFVAEHMQTDPKSLSNLQQTRKIFRDSSYYKNAMQKKLERSCLAAIKEPTGWGIEASSVMCDQNGYMLTKPNFREFNKKCKEKTNICSKVHLDANVDIPQGTVMIGKRAFASMDMEEIAIPNTVTNIGERAFLDCRFLKRVVLPESVKIIQQGAFKNCENLEELVISKDIRHIGHDAFAGCKKLNLIFQNNVPYLNRINPESSGVESIKQITFRIDFSDPKSTPFELPFGTNALPRNQWGIENLQLGSPKIAIEPAI